VNIYDWIGLDWQPTSFEFNDKLSLFSLVVLFVRKYHLLVSVSFVIVPVSIFRTVVSPFCIYYSAVVNFCDVT